MIGYPKRQKMRWNGLIMAFLILKSTKEFCIAPSHVFHIKIKQQLTLLPCQLLSAILLHPFPDFIRITAQDLRSKKAGSWCKMIMNVAGRGLISNCLAMEILTAGVCILGWSAWRCARCQGNVFPSSQFGRRACEFNSSCEFFSYHQPDFFHSAHPERPDENKSEINPERDCGKARTPLWKTDIFD